MKLKNINDVLDELQGSLENVIDDLYDANGIVYGLRAYTVTPNNPKLKNFIAGFNEMRDMERELANKLYELQTVADGLSDGIEAETEEQAKEPTK